MLFDLFAEKTFPIGVEITAKAVRMAQLNIARGQIEIIAGGSKAIANEVEPYSGQWQRRAIDAVKTIYSSAPFKSKTVVTAMPSTDVFSREIRKKIVSPDIINAEAKNLLGSSAEAALIKHIILNENNNTSDEKDILILATEKLKVERYLAIFEQAGLDVKAVIVWPIVMVNCCVHIFGRRRADADSIVLLINADAAECHIVICRHCDILFARAVPIGTIALNSPDNMEKLIYEIEACIRYFQTIVKTADIERIILLGSGAIESNLTQCVLTVAKKYAMPAHIGDVLAAAINGDIYSRGIDCRETKDDWTTTFGLSLSGCRNKEEY